MGEFLIWSVEHNSWWRPKEMGYTRELSDAGRYGEGRAREIVEDANIVACHECMIPVECTRTVLKIPVVVEEI